MLKKLVTLSLLMLGLPIISYGQNFGKNNMRYSQLDQFYASYRFDIWHNFDSKNSAEMEYLRQVIENLEGARDWMGGPKVFNHNIEKRIPVFIYKTHTDMESSNLVGGFMPEGVGAFVESERSRMVLKADFSRPLGRAIGVHELVHEFQFDIENPSLVQKATGSVRLPNGYYEGCAEYIAGVYDPHTRDEIRRREQRNYAANPKSLPTWQALNSGRINPYTTWSMIPEFLESKSFGGVIFCTEPLKNNMGLGEFVYDLSRGELGNPDVNSERFDQKHRHYWGTEQGFEADRISRPKPYEENDNFSGKSITPYGHPYPMKSPALSPDGSQVAAFTFLRGQVTLARYNIPRDTVYISREDREALKKEDTNKVRLTGDRPYMKNLTPQLPPVPWEYLIAQGFNTWPFNGFDVSWSPDGSKIAFFARVNRDHALIIIDADTGKVFRKIELESPSLDQAFSPVFSPDGSRIYFSAAEHTVRNIYSAYIGDFEENFAVRSTNDDRFNTAPAISPDGRELVYVGFDGDFQHLFILHANGIKEQLTFGRFNDSSPSWSDDGSTLVYTSDQADRIWNLYTLDLKTRVVSQWTEFMGGVETPLFVHGKPDTVYCVIFRDDDQYVDFIYPNYEIFEIKLKKPISQYKSEDNKEPVNFTFNPNRDLFKFELDSNQLLNHTVPPENLNCRGGNLSIGVSTYWGMFGQSYMECSNMLETKQHIGLFAVYGDLRIINYSYLNQEERTSWRWGAHHYQLPLYYQFYDIVERHPNQFILNNTWMKESGLDLITSRPTNKFNRWEFFSKLSHRSFDVFGIGISNFDESIFDESPEIFSEGDLQMYRFLRTSNSSNLSFGTAYVRDTILYSGDTWGPWHGNAFRAQFEAAPPMGREFEGYISGNVNVRTYRRLSDGVLVAGRVDLMSSSKANGEFILLCGPERIRGCDYGSIAGNNVAYGSIELRFPLLDAIIAPKGLNFGGVRGFFFADGAVAKFSNEKFPAQRIKAYGVGLQYTEPLMGLPLNFVWSRENGKFNPTFYITRNW